MPEKILLATLGPIPASAAYAIVLGTSSVLLAQGVEHAATEMTYKAVSQLGLSMVLAISGFFLLVWWVRKNISDQREDSLRTQQRLTEVEKFNQEKLLNLVIESTAANARVAEATEANTKRMEEMTDSVRGLNTRMRGRLCMAIESLSPEDRRQVYSMMAKERLEGE